MEEKENNNWEAKMFGRYLCGDKASGEELFASIYPRVRKFVFSKTKSDTCLDEQDKEDIIVEAMMRTIDKKYLFNGKSSLSTFVIGFANNIIREKRRERKKQLSTLLNSDQSDQIESMASTNNYDNPIKVIINNEELDMLEQSLNLLTQDQRNILILRICNGMSFKEITQITGKLDAAVDSLYRRALRTLKNNYKKTIIDRRIFYKSNINV
ncbi:MAG: RNA polymerase sigma factor [Acidaminococcaceae bacterium]